MLLFLSVCLVFFVCPWGVCFGPGLHKNCVTCWQTHAGRLKMEASPLVFYCAGFNVSLAVDTVTGIGLAEAVCLALIV